MESQEKVDWTLCNAGAKVKPDYGTRCSKE